MEVDPMTDVAVWSTESLPQRGAFDAWSEKMSELHLAWTLSRPASEEFSAVVRYRRLHDLTIADFRGGRFAGSRLERGLQMPGRQMVGVLLNLSGRLVCRYGGEELVLGPNQMLVWDSALAYSFDAVEPHHELSVMLPRDRVPVALRTIAARTSTVSSAAPGSGLVSVSAEQLKAITRELGGISDAGLQIACQSFFDTLDAALTAPIDHAMTAARAGLLVQVRGYIEDHLDDPGLCASSIADAHAISVRTLHLLFADTGTTVSRLIRQRRLDVCYRELSRGRRGNTVTDVAFRWGFNDAAHFSRSFKQAFGVTPSSVISR
jgi:AraC-like DNA-binding protein